MKIDVSQIAKLANVPLLPLEEDPLKKQIETTLDHVERLNEIDTSKVKETNQVNNLSNVWRQDEIKPSLSQEKALMNAKRTHNGFFVVPAILEEATN